MKKKCLFFCQDTVGGAERMTTLIGKSLNQDLYEVVFFLVNRHAKSSITDFIPKEIRTITLYENGYFSLILNMIKALIKEKPDIVFSSVYNLSNKLLLLKWVAPHAKFIIRCDNYIYTYNNKQQKLLRKTYPKADVLIAQTEEMGNELIEQLGIKAEKVNVLHNPIDKDLIDKKLKGTTNPFSHNEKKHYVAMGRFDPQKGFDLLIEAFIKVHQINNNTELFIVGDTWACNGEVAMDVRKKAEEAGISELVHFAGYQNNPYPYIKYADCFVLSSRWEGLPNVLIEALYLGIPVAAFKCIPIIERIVNDGINGVLAEKEDVESLASAMIKATDMNCVTSYYESAEISSFTQLFD